MTVLDLELLDGFRLSPGQVQVPRSGQRVLAYLALHPGPVLRGHLAATLWPEGTDARAVANLRSTLRRLPRPSGVALVVAGPTHVSLPVWVSVDLHRARAAADADPATATAAADLLATDLLPEWDDDWLVAERERHRQLRLRALERLCSFHREHGRLDEAWRAGLAAVAADPLRESAHRALVRLHRADGNAAEALRQYQTYRRLLLDELGLAPSPLIRALVADLLGRPADAPREQRAQPLGRGRRPSGVSS